MNTVSLGRAETPLSVSLRRIATLSVVAGYVEVIGFTDIGEIYPGIMTGNTVQLGASLAQSQWPRVGIIGLGVGLFVMGGIIASLIKRHVRFPPAGLLLMAAVLIVAGLLRGDSAARIEVELPLLALAMAMQGEASARFGSVSLQTIVVTNSLVKFSDALVGRYLWPHFSRKSRGEVPLKEVLMPGVAWLTYSLGAVAGAIAAGMFRFPLLVPATLLALLVTDVWKASSRPAKTIG